MVVLAATLASCGGRGSGGPLRVGVMLPLTGPGAVGYRAPLQWARDTVNAAGGVRGRRIDLVFRDIAREPVEGAARAFAADSSIVAAIGPDNSADALQAGALFVKAHKVLTTPSATSSDLFRAFAPSKPHYFWRPVESDVAQTRELLTLATTGGARSVALVSGRRSYGTTFFDWFGFLATEVNVRVTATIRYDEQTEPCDRPMHEAFASRPDAVIAAPDDAAQAVCMATAWRTTGSGPRLLMSDGAENPAVLQALGPAADGLEGTAPAPDPGNGFARAYQARFAQPAPPYAANTYDSLLLLAYGLARSNGAGGAALAEAVGSVVHGTTAPVGWDGDGVRRALAAIRAGRLPAVSGAVGTWKFDRRDETELVSSTYEHWHVTNGRFAAAGYLSSADAATAAAGHSAATATAATDHADSPTRGTSEVPPKTGTWALLVAASDGWENYRHQADVLAQYQRLRANGVSADHIIVVMADDIADDRRNSPRGTVRYTDGGPNLDDGVRADYSPTRLTAAQLMDVLAGRAGPAVPRVLRTGPGDDVYVYMAGHGNDNGLYLGLGQAIPPPTAAYSVLTPEALDATISTMAAEHRYRRILVALEACQGGTFGTAFRSPDALLLTAAGPNEDSLSTNYDAHLGTWLADQFSFELWLSEAPPTRSLDDLYRRVYLSVPGSHARAYGPAFGDPATVSIAEFLTP